MSAPGNGSLPLVASVSGGKDSAAMCLHLKELGIRYRAVFIDTGWEAPQTYDYLSGTLERAVGPIERIAGDLSMPQLVRRKQTFPGINRRFCTEQLKVDPLLDWLRERHGGEIVCNAVGVRRAESRQRALLDPVEAMPETLGQLIVWRPILHWSEEQVIAIHRRHGLAPNPLYLEGCARVGCWPCVLARKSEVRLVSEVDPRRIDEIRALERELQASAARRYAARGESFASLGLSPPTYFTRTVAGRATRTPIDEMVQWARAGADVEEGDRGCMRWGLCA